MAAENRFKGFPRESVAFYDQLKEHNDKAWFAEHKGEFEEHVILPARDFVVAMGERLRALSPHIIADARQDRSIFRVYRDTRFSKDKSPYKTHLGIFFWEGKLTKMDCPGYYFHLEPPLLMLAAGNHCFSKKILGPYRDAVVDPVQGPALAKAVTKVEKHQGYSVGGEHYARTPRGYDPNHPNADLLRYNGLYAMTATPVPDELFSSDIIEYCFSRFNTMAPIHEWLVKMTDGLA